MSNNQLLENLNQSQIEAVTHTEGPLLVLSGAGTGKTKVLTSRYAYIVEKNLARADEILAVTFTNKAAKEMQERVTNLIGRKTPFNSIGTFHSVSLLILRKHADLIGYSKYFSITDQNEQDKIIAKIVRKYKTTKERNYYKIVLNIINRWKDTAVTYKDITNHHLKNDDYILAKEVYKEYQEYLKSNNSMDFGDLILNTIELLNNNKEVLDYMQNKVKYLMIDEYQDTSISQYLWVRIFAEKSKNICAVGDEDQSIYGWRGAEIDNIFRFEKDFPNTKIIRLEQNYRSTGNIINAASSLIAKNSLRLGKTLWTNYQEGEEVNLYRFYNEQEEANYIAKKIKELKKEGEDKSIAILVRSAFLTRSIEEALNHHNVKYTFSAGIKFYERLEIKDVIAYLRLAFNQEDDMAFLRIINLPKRGIGDSKIESIQLYKSQFKLSYFQSIKKMIENGLIKNQLASKIQNFIDLIENHKEISKLNSNDLYNMAKSLIEKSEYLSIWNNNAQEDLDRINNINELLNSLVNYESLEEFLDSSSLIQDESEESLTKLPKLMTIHAAKGLEFDCVFLPGWEEGIFPSERSIFAGAKNLEEERRLAYVAITRARKILTISFCKTRQVFGYENYQTYSRFIRELQKTKIQDIVTV